MKEKVKAIRFSPTIYAAVVSVLAVALCVALPQTVHLIGQWTGLGSGLGEMLLPMHLPVMVAGVMGGPVAGLLAGLVSPVISFGLTGMPMAAMVPFMTVELATYGLCAGLLRKRKMPVPVQVLLTQVAGRLARAAVLLVAVYACGFTGLPVSIIWTSVPVGAVGILLQLVLVPVLARAVRK